MHSPVVRSEAMVLIEAGVNDCEVARMLGIPRATVRDWRRPTYMRRRPAIPRVTCPRCWQSAKPMAFSLEDYAELLGLYLGDGHIVALKRTQKLRISLDAKYPGIVSSTASLLERCFPDNAVDPRVRDNRVDVTVHSNHLPCVFPQHGPGRKHTRNITLEPWQVSAVEAAPFAYLRGCIWSDGCVFVNRTGRYAYRSYCFDNRSDDIRELFSWACGLAGVHCAPNRRSVRIYARDAVAALDNHIGDKR